jgi:hypothetical protein
VTTVLLELNDDDRVVRRNDAVPPARLRALTAAAVACGVAGDLFFDAGPGGVGLALYLVAMAGAVAAAARGATIPLALQERDAVPPHTRLLLGLAALFALLVAMRGSEVLTVFNTLAALSLIGLAATAWPGSGLNLLALRVRDLVLAGFLCARDALLGTPLFLHRDGRRLFRHSRASSTGVPVTSAVVRAVFLSVALVVVFGALLSAGDPVFRGSVRWLGSWDLPPLGSHLLKIVFFGWPVLGIAWNTGRRGASNNTGDVARPGPLMRVAEAVAARAGIVLNRLDVLAALGAMNALFALFLVLQVRVLFGGQAYVTATTGLTMAEYARSGFFALTVTAAMVVGLLLLLDTLMGPERLSGWRVSRRLASLLLAFVGVVLCSAVARMLLYVSSFGISVDRVVALAIIAWVAMVSAWFSVTVLRGRPARFLIGALFAGAATLLTLNAINIDAIVVRSGLARVAAGHALDVEYMTANLSADAVPALVDAVVDGRMEPIPAQASVPAPVPAAVEPGARGAACTTAAMLLQWWGPAVPSNASQWTVSAWRARRAVARHQQEIAAIACPVSRASTQRAPA